MYSQKRFGVSSKTPRHLTQNASAFLKYAAAKYIFATAYSVPLSSSSEREYRNEKTI